LTFRHEVKQEVLWAEISGIKPEKRGPSGASPI
jgi:hypothetical protein